MASFSQCKIICPKAWPKEFHEIVEKLANGVPLSFEDGVELFKSKDLNTIGSLANHVKHARFGKNAFFNVNVTLTKPTSVP